MERIRLVSGVSDRLLELIPGVGLLSSLILLSGVLSGSERSRELIGVAWVFTPFLISLAAQLLLNPEAARKWGGFQNRCELYFSTLETGILGIQSGLNPELLSERMRVRIQTGRTWNENQPAR